VEEERWANTACLGCVAGGTGRYAHVGPNADGKHFARAEWIKAGAADVIRVGWDVGGISGMKIVHLCECST
jgi:hypothetical protein